MDADRFHRVEELYHAALDLDADQRSTFLAEACGDDADLRFEVISLLAADSEIDARLGSSVAEALGEVLDDVTERPPARIGSYEILKEIGRGGLSTVYLAERADREYRARVAIKLVRPGMATGEIRSRLRLERQILASLKHPHIAQLLDGGTRWYW